MATGTIKITLEVYAQLYFKPTSSSSYYSSYTKTAKPIYSFTQEVKVNTSNVGKSQTLHWYKKHLSVKDITDSYIGGSGASSLKASGDNCIIDESNISAGSVTSPIKVSLNLNGGSMSSPTEINLNATQKKKQLQTIKALTSKLGFKSGATKNSPGGEYDRSNGVTYSDNGVDYVFAYTFTPTVIESVSFTIKATLFQQSKTTLGEVKNDGGLIYPKYTLPAASSVTKSGFNFDHWRENYDEASSNWVGHLGGNTVQLGKSNTKFLAVYKAKSFKLEYDLNSGSIKQGVTLPSTFTYGQPVDFTNYIIRNDIYRDGYVFNGFTIKSGSGTFGSNFYPYIPGCIYNSDGTTDTTIKATWKEKSYLITYNLNYNKPSSNNLNSIPTQVNFFDGSSNKDRIEQEYNPENNQTILSPTDWLVGYEFNSPLVYRRTSSIPNWTNFTTVTEGTSTNGMYGDATLVLDVKPIEYKLDYISYKPVDFDNQIIKFDNVNFIYTPKSTLPKSYTILDNSIDLYSERLFNENTLISLEGNILKLGIDRGYFYNNNQKFIKTEIGNWVSTPLNNVLIGVAGPYKEHEDLYFTERYKKAKYKFRFNYLYDNPDNYHKKETTEYDFLDQITADLFEAEGINLTLSDKEFIFDGWTDGKISVLDKNGNPINNSNESLNYFWKSGTVYYLIAEKGETETRIIDLYPKWSRKTGLRVYDGKNWNYSAEYQNTNLDDIRINDINWNSIKQMKVYDGEGWCSININQRPIDPSPPPIIPTTYEEI